MTTDWIDVQRKPKKPKTKSIYSKPMKDKPCAKHGQQLSKICAFCNLQACSVCYPGTFKYKCDLCIYCRMAGDVLYKGNIQSNRDAELFYLQIST